jgi:hypothetical protein
LVEIACLSATIMNFKPYFCLLYTWALSALPFKTEPKN